MTKTLLSLIAVLCAALPVCASTPILGKPVATAEQMYQYVKSKNAGSSFTREIANEFYEQGVKYGIRGDIALCQSCVETGWFRYEGGTAVTPDDHNYCGLGVTSLGKKGCQFSTVADGVAAQLQHLWAYATTAALPSGWTLQDPRFKYVNRGCAPNWEDLGGGKWASATGYGANILSIYRQMAAYQVDEEDPAIEVSKDQISLSGKKGGTAPSVTLTVKGSGLKSDISYNSSTGAVKLTASPWNARTGGTLTVTLNTDFNPGTYTGIIAIQSGSGSSRVRREVQLSVTILPADQGQTGEDLALPTSFTRNWIYCGAESSSASYFNPANDLTRNMVLKGDNLYIVQRGTSDCSIHIVDAYTGTVKGQLPTTGITLNNYVFSSVAVLDDGTILAVNMGYSATTKLTVYAWTSDTSAPVKVLETTNHSGRSGDLMSASGTLESGRIYLTTNSGFSGHEGRVMVYDITDGKASATPSVITLRNASGAAYNLGGGFAVIEVRKMADGNLLASGCGGETAIFTADGALVSTLHKDAVDGQTGGSSCALFDYGKRKLAATVAYKDGVKEGYLNLVDATDMNAPVLVRTFNALGASGVDNPTRVTTALARLDGSQLHLWVLIPKQGIAAYRASVPSGVGDIAADSDNLRFAVAPGSVTALGDGCRALSVYDMTGSLVAAGNGAELNHNLMPGAYIIVADTYAGPVSSRLMLR